MSAETTSSTDPANQPLQSGTEPRGPATPAAPGAGPLARFTRSSESADSPASAEPTKAAEPSAATPPATASAPPAQAPAGYRPRGRGDRPKSRREKEREEDRQVDRELAAERQAREERGRHSAVPVPNLRQRSEELEAEVEAALGGVSLDEIVKGDLKTDANRLENGSRHRAQIVDLHSDDVFFALGGKNQGITSVRNFAEPPKPGDMIDVTVTGYNSEDNLYHVSVAGGAIVSGNWSDIAEGSLVEARITGSNTGGLECQVSGIRGFIPVSQISLYRVENTADYVGQSLVCVVTESNERRGKVVLSRRAVLEREKEETKKQLMAELQPGVMREGTIRKIHDFGA